MIARQNRVVYPKTMMMASLTSPLMLTVELNQTKNLDCHWILMVKNILNAISNKARRNQFLSVNYENLVLQGRSQILKKNVELNPSQRPFR